MALSETVSNWIIGAKIGDSSAVERLWERYFDRLVRLARHRLRGARPCAVEDEDIALSAFAGFCEAARAGRFPRLGDRDGLWRLLIKMTARKIADYQRRDGARKRGGGQIQFGGDLSDIVGEAPTPDFAAMVAEQTEVLLNQLDEPLQAIALAKLDGYGNREIADRFQCSVSTIERKLSLIRRTWRNHEES